MLDESLDFLSIKQLSKKLNIKISTLRFLIFKKEIPIVRIGKSIRFSPIEINAWLDSKRHKLN